MPHRLFDGVCELVGQSETLSEHRFILEMQAVVMRDRATNLHVQYTQQLMDYQMVLV